MKERVCKSEKLVLLNLFYNSSLFILPVLGFYSVAIFYWLEGVDLLLVIVHRPNQHRFNNFRNKLPNNLPNKHLPNNLVLEIILGKLGAIKKGMRTSDKKKHLL